MDAPSHERFDADPGGTPMCKVTSFPAEGGAASVSIPAVRDRDAGYVGCAFREDEASSEGATLTASVVVTDPGVMRYESVVSASATSRSMPATICAMMSASRRGLLVRCG